MTTRTANSLQAQIAPESATAAVWAVVPVKPLNEAKQRLHACLGAKREEFTLAMLEDVLKALADSRLVDHIACVTADPGAAALAARHGAQVVEEGRARGMNEAIRIGIDEARSRGATIVVVLPADLPLATGFEIDRLLLAMGAETSPGSPAVIGLSPAADGRGTNFLCLGTDRPFESRFGEDSFQRHQACARAEGLHTVLLDSTTLSMDVDCQQDLQDLISYCSQHPEFQCTSTWKYLARSGLAGTPKP